MDVSCNYLSMLGLMSNHVNMKGAPEFGVDHYARLSRASRMDHSMAPLRQWNILSKMWCGPPAATLLAGLAQRDCQL